MARFPFSIWLFVCAGGLFLLLAFPFTGIVLLMIGGIFWPGFLINLGMIGTLIEALSKRVHRAWLIVPLAFYGSYLSVVASERIILASLQSSYEKINAETQVPFDHTRYSLVFENSETGAQLVADYGLDTAFSASEKAQEGYRSVRLAEKETCDLIGNSEAELPYSVRTDPIFDRSRRYVRRLLERRFCTVSFDEGPSLPSVRVKKTSTESKRQTLVSELSVRFAETTITMPDGKVFLLNEGTASPLPLFPMPIMGCALISAGPSWECFAMFYRDSHTPILRGNTRVRRENWVLANALGLQPFLIGGRKAAKRPKGKTDRFAKVIKETEDYTLQSQIDDIRALFDAPASRDLQRNFEALAQDEAALIRNKGDILAALQAAAFYDGEKIHIARDNGRMLIDYLMLLPDESFATILPSLTALFSAAPSDNWLWEMSRIRRRLEDAGVVLAR